LSLVDQERENASNQMFLVTFAICGLVAATLVATVVLFLVRKHSKSREKLARLSQDDPSFEASKEYQVGCTFHTVVTASVIYFEFE